MKPSETIIIGESSDCAIASASYAAVLYYPGATNVSKYPDRHEDAFNTLWVDGHVSLLKTIDFQTGKPSTNYLANGKNYYMYSGAK